MAPQHMRRELWQMDEIVEEIFFRLPPDEPGSLLRASLVCKPWCHLLSDHGFCRRYREFHQQKPPMLGFLQSWFPSAMFVPTTGFRPREPDPRHRYSVYDCRHGRVLLWYWDEDEQSYFLAVWDPMTGSQRVLRAPAYPGISDCRAWVLCAANGCNHGDCHLGPFLVVFVSLHEREGVAMASVYSSETSNWSSPASLDVGFFEYEINFFAIPSVLARDALYFLLSRDYIAGETILKYALGKCCLSEIHGPSAINYARLRPILLAAENGRLGIADLDGVRLSVWWMDVTGPDEAAVWTQRTVIDLETLLPIGNTERPTELLGSIEGTGIVFAITDLGTYMIDLKSLSSKKISNELCRGHPTTIRWALFPYLSFYDPPVVAGAVAEASSEAGHGNEKA